VHWARARRGEFQQQRNANKQLYALYSFLSLFNESVVDEVFGEAPGTRVDE
jgi:hypothetical protein